MFSKSVSLLFFFLFFFLLPQPSYPLKITEVYHTPVNSKYYNQAIELFNDTAAPLTLTNFFYQVGEGETPLLLFSASQQAKLQATGAVFNSPTLQPGEVALVLDKGYRLQEAFNLAGKKVFTIGENSLALKEARYLQPDMKIALLDSARREVDAFFIPANFFFDGISLERLDPAFPARETNLTFSLTSAASAAEKFSLALRFSSLGEKNLSHQYYSAAPPVRLALLPLENFKTENESFKVQTTAAVVGAPQIFQAVFLTAEHKIARSVNGTIAFNSLTEEKALWYYHHDGKSINTSRTLHFQAGRSQPFTLLALLAQNLTFKAQVSGRSFSSALPVRLPAALPTKPTQTFFLTELTYHRDNDEKLLNWVEFQVEGEPVPAASQSLFLSWWNSSYKKAGRVALPESTYANGGYYVVAHTNTNFTARYPWAEQVVGVSDSLPFTASGVIALERFTEAGGFEVIEAIRYDKNWFENFSSAGSLQRIAKRYPALEKKNWRHYSTGKKTTPLLPNEVERSESLSFAFSLCQNSVPQRKVRLAAQGFFSQVGTVEVKLHSFAGKPLFSIFSAATAAKSASERQTFEVELDASRLSPGPYLAVIRYKALGQEKEKRQVLYIRP